jgi:hypothetical protein
LDRRTHIGKRPPRHRRANGDRNAALILHCGHCNAAKHEGEGYEYEQAEQDARLASPAPGATSVA